MERTLRTAVTMKLVDLAVQAMDGTQVDANASLNRSYDAPRNYEGCWNGWRGR